jgi:putative hydroxymethylpyrimidine transport system substrate-binding protein
MRSAYHVRDPAAPVAPRRARGRTSRVRLTGALAAGALACAGCGEVHVNGTALGRPRQLTVALNGPPSALYAPLYEGAADGAFTRGALRVTLAPESSDTGALAALESGRAQVAVASEAAVLAARASGERVVAIGALENGPLEAIISLRPLPSARALVGKTVVTDGTALASAELESYLAGSAVTTAQLRIVRGDTQTLVTHRAYAMLGRWDLDAVSLALAHHHPTVNRTLGVPTYTDLAIVVRVAQARYDGALLRAFLQSLGRAERATRADPTAAAKAIVEADPALRLKFEIAALAATQTVAQPAQAGEPYGYQNPVSWQSFGDWLEDHGLARSSAVAGDTITDEFLPGQGE